MWNEYLSVVLTTNNNYYFAPDILFGGRGSDTSLVATSDLWLLRRDELDSGVNYLWERKIPSGTPPTRRMGHSAVAFPDGSMQIFGGITQMTPTIVTGDVHKLTYNAGFNTWTWSQVTTSGTPPADRAGHGAFVDVPHNRMIMNGGVNASGVVVDSALWTLSSSGAWGQISTVLADSATGTKPLAREGHVFVWDKRQRSGGPYPNSGYRAILFGGNNGSGAKFKDLWALWVNTAGDSAKWEKINAIAGPAPRTRAAGGIDRISDRLVISGGENVSGSTDSLWAIDLGNVTDAAAPSWYQLAAGTPPAGSIKPLAGHSMTFISGYITPPPFARKPEIYDPTGNSWTHNSAAKLQEWFPFMFVLPSGNVFAAGPSGYTYVLKTTLSSPTWDNQPYLQGAGFKGGSAVMYRPGKFMKCGTRDTEGDPVIGSTATTSIIERLINNATSRHEKATSRCG